MIGKLKVCACTRTSLHFSLSFLSLPRSLPESHQSELHLQSRLALLLVDHLSLLLSLSLSQDTTHMSTPPAVPDPTTERVAPNETTRLGSFTVQNLLDSSTPYERSNSLSHNSGCLGSAVSMTNSVTKDSLTVGLGQDGVSSLPLGGILVQPTSSWLSYGSPLNQQYTPTVDHDWPHLPNQGQCRFGVSSEEPYCHSERLLPTVSSSPQPVWRPYNDHTVNTLLTHVVPPTTTTNGYNRPLPPPPPLTNSSSFLVGQLLENILQ